MIRTVKHPGTRSAKLTNSSALYQGACRFLIRNVPLIPSDQRYNLTVCHERQFLWFRVAKVASRTIFDVFEQAGLSLDAEHAMFCHYPVRLYRSYFKFAFVRNPWDRLVSCWHDKVIKTAYFGRSAEANLKLHDFEYFVHRVAKSDLTKSDQHLRLQSKLIDLNHVDFIGRFESLEQDMAKVVERLQLEGVEIRRKNVSKNRSPYRDYYDDRLRNIVEEIYRRDIHLFSYKF